MEYKILDDSNGMTEYHYIREDNNGNLVLLHYAIPPKYKYIQEDFYPSGKSVLTPSWSPNQHKTYLWKDSHTRNDRIDRIVLTMFGYSNISKPTIDYIIRKSNNIPQDVLETIVESNSWQSGNDTRRNLPPDYYLKHPNRDKYLDDLTNTLGSQFRESRKKKTTKPKPKRKVCRCKK
jgi:hypothetical protein